MIVHLSFDRPICDLLSALSEPLCSSHYIIVQESPLGASKLTAFDNQITRGVQLAQQCTATPSDPDDGSATQTPQEDIEQAETNAEDKKDHEYVENFNQQQVSEGRLTEGGKYYDTDAWKVCEAISKIQPRPIPLCCRGPRYRVNSGGSYTNFCQLR